MADLTCAGVYCSCVPMCDYFAWIRCQISESHTARQHHSSLVHQFVLCPLACSEDLRHICEAVFSQKQDFGIDVVKDTHSNPRNDKLVM